jgi:hypothetical protein
MEQNKILKFQRQDEDLNRSPHLAEFALPQKAFFTLKEACYYKKLNYKTACNRPALQRNSGKADGTVGGRKVWRYATIAGWIAMTAAEIEKMSGDKARVM